MPVISVNKSVSAFTNYFNIQEEKQNFHEECKKWGDKDQSYDGTFLGDCLHGFGAYKWRDSGVYEGTFYSNIKEGYAIISLPNNSIYEGLFMNNQPFGPGILTYSNGRQDIGFWVGEKLVRLSRCVDYIVPRLASTVSAKIKLMRFRRLIPLSEEDDEAVSLMQKYNFDKNLRTPYSRVVYDPRSFFFYKSVFETARFISCSNITKRKYSENETEKEFCNKKIEICSAISLDTFCNDNILIWNNKFDEENFIKDQYMGVLNYYSEFGNLDNLFNDLFKQSSYLKIENEHDVIEIKGMEDDKNVPPKLISWNRSDLCSEIVKQIYKYRYFEEKLNFSIADLMSGVRTAFRKTGEKERQCIYFLKMCSLGPASVIADLLCNNEISQELMDSRGNNGIMFAAASDQLEIIDILANYGVDLNAFNDECLTPLNLCLLRRLAESNKIRNWEKAFLPPETEELGDMEPEIEFLKDQHSIQSLDRVFGDGMSANDINTPDRFKPITAYANETDKNTESKLSSQVTIMNFRSSKESEEAVNSLASPSISFITGNRSETPDAKIKYVPFSIKREEYLKSIENSTDDKFFFNLQIDEVFPSVEKGKKSTSKDEKKGSHKDDYKNTSIIKLQKNVAEETENINLDTRVSEKLKTIDKTIEKLLKRGADPNISDAPKPSIHLAVFTQEINIVRLLLEYDADANRKLYPDEGLLTPLHVLVLLKPNPIYVQMCQLLLDFGANAEEKTHPNFSINDEEKSFLNVEYGRTALQLICMRKDLEYGDPNNDIMALAILLAKISDKKVFYNGHSPLTLAMLFGNVRLLKLLLETGYFDPNEILGENLGTPLCVLVSTPLQKKTTYDNSIKMCDLLLAAGADSLMVVNLAPFEGTCVDYGYREIDFEMKARKAGSPDKKQNTSSKPEKGSARDHIKDHIRVLEYLRKRPQKTDKSDRQTAEHVTSSSKESGPAKRKIVKEVQSTQSHKKPEKRVHILNETDIINITDDSSFSKKEWDKGFKGSQYDDDNTENNDGRYDDEITDDGNLIGSHGLGKGRRGKAGSGFGKNKDKIILDKKNKNRKDAKGLRDKKFVSKGNENMTDKDGRGDSIEATEDSRKHRALYLDRFLKLLMHIFGGCANTNVDQFLLPYAVLKNGNFYYKFQGTKSVQKEQYSLI